MFFSYKEIMVVVHSRHSAVYAHILYGGEWYIGTNGSCWILQSTVHYIPPVSVGRYLPARLISIHLACGLAWQKAKGTISFLAYFLLPQGPKPIVQFFFPRSTVLH